MSGDIIIPIITGITSLLTGYFAFRLKSKASLRDDFQMIVDTLRSQFDELKIENDRLRELNTQQAQEIQQLKHHIHEIDIELRILRAGYFESPLATWVKNEDGEMLFVSKEYEKLFLKPIGKKRADYIGNVDNVIWGDVTGNDFRKHDQYVRTTGKTWVGVESFIMESGENLFANFYFMKYPFDPDGKGIIKGHVAGIAFPLTDEIINHIKMMN